MNELIKTLSVFTHWDRSSVVPLTFDAAGYMPDVAPCTLATSNILCVQGWQCPKCQAIYAPFVTSCMDCLLRTSIRA